MLELKLTQASKWRPGLSLNMTSTMDYAQLFSALSIDSTLSFREMK